MSKAAHIKECEKLIRDIKRKTYFPAAFPVYEYVLAELVAEQTAAGLNSDAALKVASQKVLSRLHDIMRAAQPLVEQVITDRVTSGEIRSADQARKSAAGNVFQQMLAYAIAQNIIIGNVTKPVAVTMSVNNLIEQYAAIHVNEDVLKPDSDVIVYAPEGDDSPIMNFSCKTSCRERAGQTYKWKLMCDLATCNCDHKDTTPTCPVTKYNLTYSPSRQILTCFATTDFYNELSNPQVSAMFNFFDYAYIAKPTSPSNRISILETVVDDINQVF